MLLNSTWVLAQTEDSHLEDCLVETRAVQSGQAWIEVLEGINGLPEGIEVDHMQVWWRIANANDYPVLRCMAKQNKPKQCVDAGSLESNLNRSKAANEQYEVDFPSGAPLQVRIPEPYCSSEPANVKHPTPGRIDFYVNVLSETDLDEGEEQLLKDIVIRAIEDALEDGDEAARYIVHLSNSRTPRVPGGGTAPHCTLRLAIGDPLPPKENGCVKLWSELKESVCWKKSVCYCFDPEKAIPLEVAMGKFFSVHLDSFEDNSDQNPLYHLYSYLLKRCQLQKKDFGTKDFLALLVSTNDKENSNNQRKVFRIDLAYSISNSRVQRKVKKNFELDLFWKCREMDSENTIETQESLVKLLTILYKERARCNHGNWSDLDDNRNSIVGLK
jgi:hypothetical protein